jgi:hypothetical protein
MHILQDHEYWTRAVGDMWRTRPSPGQPMPNSELSRFLGIVCKVLTDLDNDLELQSDLNRASSIVRQHLPGELRNHTGFQGFIGEFLRCEKALILASGLSLDVANDLLTELHTVAKTARRDPSATMKNDDETRDLTKHLVSLRSKACHANNYRPSEVKNYRGLIKGWATIGINYAASLGAFSVEPVVFGPTLSSTVNASSIAFGTTIVVNNSNKLLK